MIQFIIHATAKTCQAERNAGEVTGRCVGEGGTDFPIFFGSLKGILFFSLCLTWAAWNFVYVLSWMNSTYEQSSKGHLA